MKFTCDKENLSETINNVSLAVSSKSTLIALEGILIKCKNNSLSLTGYNLDLGITKKIEVNSIEDGNIILNAALLSNIISKMPDGKITFASDEKLLTIITCKDAEFTILGLNAEEYPEIPTLTNENEFEIPHFLLKNMISQTLFSIAQNDQNPIHTGSLFDINNGIFNLVSVDGYRLALRKEKIKSQEKLKFVVPGKTLSEIVKLLSKLVMEDDDYSVKICVSERHIIFNICGYSLISRLLDGEFLDYKSAIPVSSKTSVKVKTKDFIESINRASIIINEKAKSPIRCEFKENCGKLFCETSVGKISDSFPAVIDGEEVKIGFNNKYMYDALKATDCDEVLIQISGPLSPMKVVSINDESFLFLVLPVRLKDAN